MKRHKNKKKDHSKLVVIALAISLFAAEGYLSSGDYLNALDFLPASRLLKTEDSPTVYYVNSNRQKMPIPSAEIFLSYGNRWDQVEVVQQEELNFYKDAEYIKLEGDGRVYKLKDGVKRYLTQKAASALEIFPEEVVAVNKKEFNVYKKGETLDEKEALDLRSTEESQVLVLANKEVCVPDENVGGEDGCKIFKAQQLKDPNICESITASEWKGKCYSAFIPKSPDPLLYCNKLSENQSKYNCIQSMAVAKGDQNLCAQIGDEAKKTNCQAYVGLSLGQPNSCDSLSSEQGNPCNYVYGILKSDLSSCNKITDVEMKKACLESVGQSLALSLISPKPKILGALEKIFIKKAHAQFSSVVTRPIGGKFLSGLTYDIFTVTPSIPPCMIVSVVGPQPGVFSWKYPRIYDDFFKTPWHANTNMVGLSTTFPTTCPPELLMFGSSLTP